MNYRHLSVEARSCMRKYYEDGLCYQEIAHLIGWNVSTVFQEIRRNCAHIYDIAAQKKYLLRRSYCYRGMFHSSEVVVYINEKLKAT